MGGKWNRNYDSPLARCKYPGGKRKEGQDALEALQEIMAGPLASLQRAVSVNRSEYETDISHSKHFGIQTKYLKNIIHAVLNNSCDLPRGGLMQLRPSASHPAMSLAPSLGTVVSKSNSKVDLYDLQIYGLQDGDVLRVFAWVQPADIEYLCSPSGETYLMKCLGDLEFVQPQQEV